MGRTNRGNQPSPERGGGRTITFAFLYAPHIHEHEHGGASSRFLVLGSLFLVLGSLFTLGIQMTDKRDVYSTYRFWVEIDSINVAGFSECSGLQVETEIFEWEEGGRNNYKHRLPGRAKFSNLVLKRGIATADLWSWYQDSIQGKIKRRNLSVVLY